MHTNAMCLCFVAYRYVSVNVSIYVFVYEGILNCNRREGMGDEEAVSKGPGKLGLHFERKGFSAIAGGCCCTSSAP